LANSLKAFKNIKDALKEADIDPGLRPEKLSIKDFIKITDTLAAFE
jgi:16S rRNA A1518/A1519 N6-dimethyltransferase RsmA/KsgA/DIM1 with predicted DNA glycosylase/AP lyase activity